MLGSFSWGPRFALRQRLRGSLWVAPLVGLVIGLLLAAFDRRLEEAITVPRIWQYSPSTASTVLAAIVGALVALTGFLITVTVLVVQTAIGTFSARYLRLVYRDPVLRTLLAVVTGTVAFTFTLLRKVDGDYVPNIGVTVSGWLVLVALLLFLVFLDRFIHRLRPVAVAHLVSGLGRAAFRESTHVRRTRSEDPSPVIGGAPTLSVRARHAGAIQAIDTKGLLHWAAANDCVLRFRHGVGDFVESGQTLIDVHGIVASPEKAARSLYGKIAFGIERTIEQDPAFAIRVMVDIAIRALSPAVNDPTTAVQVIGYLGETMNLIGTTDLGARAGVQDEHGRTRLLLPVRRWEDYLALCVTEIREYGGNAVQVVRRLRALLEDLLEAVRPEHRASVEEELARLDATVARHFGSSVDLDRASAADPQGIGGAAQAAA